MFKFFCCSRICKSDGDKEKEIQISFEKEKDNHLFEQQNTKTQINHPYDNDSVQSKEKLDSLSFFEIKNAKNKLEVKSDISDANEFKKNSFINIVENYDSFKDTEGNKQSMLKSFNPDKSCSFFNNSVNHKIGKPEETKYSIVNKKLVKLSLDKSMEDLLEVLSQSKRLSINTYTSSCKDKVKSCTRLNTSNSKYVGSEDFYASKNSLRDKSTESNLSKLKLKSSRVFNTINKKIPSQKLMPTKPLQSSLKESKVSSPISNNVCKIKVKVEKINCHKNTTRVNKK